MSRNRVSNSKHSKQEADRLIRVTVRARADSRCERCATHGQEFHHRQARGMGGTTLPDTVANLVLLCRPCHRWATEHPSVAQAGGWVVPHGIREPAQVPIDVLGRALVLLTSYGTYRPVASLGARRGPEYANLSELIRNLSRPTLVG